MGIISKIKVFFKNEKGPKPKVESTLTVAINALTKERIAMHEAAHGLVWYLFKENWIVNQLTIERENLPDGMNGALHITANFDVKEETNIERANELFAISLAGMIGQNMNLIHQRPNLLFEFTQVENLNQIFDTTGCGGDFEIAKNYLPHLGGAFKVSEAAFTRYKTLDLISLFQDHDRVQQIHARLSILLLQKGTLRSGELVEFFEKENFQEYIKEEDLNRMFYHQ